MPVTAMMSFCKLSPRHRKGFKTFNHHISKVFIAFADEFVNFLFAFIGKASFKIISDHFFTIAKNAMHKKSGDVRKEIKHPERQYANQENKKDCNYSQEKIHRAKVVVLC